MNSVLVCDINNKENTKNKSGLQQRAELLPHFHFFFLHFLVSVDYFHFLLCFSICSNSDLSKKQKHEVYKVLLSLLY